jgi:hypothetical protein
MRQNAQRDRQHFRRHCALQVHARGKHPAQDLYIGVLDMAPILTQVQCNQVGTRRLANAACIGLDSASSARLAESLRDRYSELDHSDLLHVA